VPAKNEELLRRLLATFKIEAQEHIQAIASGLLELEHAATAPAQAAVLDVTFRAAHSLKGAARTVNVTDVEMLCQALEGVFASLKRGELALSAELFDRLHRVVDALGQRLPGAGASAASSSDVTTLIQSLHATARQNGNAAPQSVKKTEPTADVPDSNVSPSMRPLVQDRRDAVDTIRVATAKLDAVLLQAEEMPAAKLAAAECAARLRRCLSGPAEWRKRWAGLRSDVRSIRHALELDRPRSGNGAGGVTGNQRNPEWLRVSEFLEWNQQFVEALETQLAALARAAERDQRLLATRVDGLLEEMKNVVMQPFAAMLDALPRFVRDLSREQGKVVELVIRGEEIEIDRRVLEQMKDPMIHLVRNCLHHGIETPEVRRQTGKPPRGTLTISIAARDGNSVEVVVADDGSGIDLDTVKSAAVKQGHISQEKAQALNADDALVLILQSGLSTAPIITDISGRGLGLAIVSEKVQKLNGQLAIESQPGAGTTFRLVLPLTLVRFRGICVRLDEHLFVLPTSSVERVLRVQGRDIKTIENRETLVYNERAIPLVPLAEVLGLPRKAGTHGAAAHPAVLLGAGNQRIAFSIDAVLDEQEVLVKTLGSQLVRVRNIAGATVLGSGKVVPILNVPDLMRSAVRVSESGYRTAALAPQAIEARTQSVLVAEDSITSRTLLKSILETAGYQVETAVDGMEAFTKLRSGQFDLVVSDVEMPRLNGFGLTSKIRSDQRLAELPVILVTALGSRDDREHGIDVGANAYIVKSSFDEGNLLDVIRRLL
jgi:two-component system chemotaxis sensor kinase CheA